jgi:hypothetical protein
MQAVKGNSTQVVDTGRPGGRLGTSVPVSHSPQPPAGYEPEKLDGSLTKYLAVCESTIRHLESLGKQVERHVQRLEEAADGPEHDDVEHATVLFERLTKAGLNLVKATDELSRLRSFLAGGPDSRPDLSNRGEIELMEILFDAIRSRGWQVVTTDHVPVTIEVGK